LTGETDGNVARELLYLVSKRIERLEMIAARAEKPTAARASVVAAWLCNLIGQRFRANLHIQFAIASDPNNPQAWAAFLAALANLGPASEYLSVARRCAARFDAVDFQLRLADALAKSGDDMQALHVIWHLRQREPDHLIARLSEAILLLKIGDRAMIPRVLELLDRSAAAAREDSDAGLQPLCELLQACAQLVGGNAPLGRVLLDDMASRRPDDAVIKAVLAAVRE
jgi:hypothetical protein